MAITATKTTPLISLTLPGTPYSVQMARFYVRTTLNYHDLGDYVEDIEAVTSELVSNAVMHTGARTFGLELLHLPDDHGAVEVAVTDPSPLPPVRRAPAAGDEHGRGLLVVEALSARLGWRPKDSGKTVFAILTREA
jgi:anti-sigma regulatory factor (Ser/Thr protein kinase)